MTNTDETQPGVIAELRRALSTVVVGHERAIDEILIALICRGHVLIEDVPGVGKTLLARSLAAVLDVHFRRIQFTPDVLPSDITGSSVFNQQSTAFEFRPGPIFTDVLLADEINRATPRTQSALLESMEERQVTVDGSTTALGDMFLVIATQNPIELEGTFPLPEAQLDRFLLRIKLGYPSLEEEDAILLRFERGDPLADLLPVASSNDIASLLNARAMVLVNNTVRSYLLDIVRATRSDDRLLLGASPRASLGLHRASQARALLDGRGFVLPDDIKALASAVLAHRVVLTAQARLRGSTANAVIESILEQVSVPLEEEAAMRSE